MEKCVNSQSNQIIYLGLTGVEELPKRRAVASALSSAWSWNYNNNNKRNVIYNFIF